jgi:hypothetical protein
VNSAAQKNNCVGSRRQSRQSRKAHKASFNPQQLSGPLPLSEAGQRLSRLFPNGWDWIYAQAAKPGIDLEWETVRKYPLSPVELWSLHQDPNCIIGIRPNAETQWGLLDIDAASAYHPRQDPSALPRILNALEDLGLVRSLLCQSSHSGGLHLYIPLPKPIKSFGLAIALKLNLEAAGFKVRSGQLEIFPNPKRYIPQGQGFSLYNGVRLPFQPNSGFMPLDADLNPLPWGLEDWLDAFEHNAAAQDLDTLSKAIADAELNHRIRGGDRTPHRLESWQERIEAEKLGWTGAGQSNEKFKVFACEARVFLGLDSLEAIAAHVEETALNTPGFQEYSQHCHDLKQRARDVAAWAMKYYWPLGGPSGRQTGYHGPQKAPADFNYHQAKREAAQHRIKAAIAQLQAQNQLPEMATARAKAIVEIAKISQQTLYREANKPLWHPDYFPVPLEPSQSQEGQDITLCAAETGKITPQRSPEPLVNNKITGLLINVGFVMLNYWREALAALALKGQSAAQRAIPASEFSERGESEGGKSLVDCWAEVRAAQTELFQEKLAQHERQRVRQDELEQKRQQRIRQRQQRVRCESSPEVFAQLELEIQQQFGARGAGRVGLSPVGRKDDASVGAEVVVQRSPFDWEQQEFQEWFMLAERFGVVDDFYWDGGQYWVALGDRVWPYAELVGVFTVAWLRSALSDRGELL